MVWREEEEGEGEEMARAFIFSAALVVLTRLKVALRKPHPNAFLSSPLEQGAPISPFQPFLSMKSDNAQQPMGIESLQPFKPYQECGFLTQSFGIPPLFIEPKDSSHRLIYFPPA